MSAIWVSIALAAIKTVAIVLVFVMVMATVLTWAERRQSAMVQNRIGPNRANIGPFTLAGLLHPVADAIKTLYKEDITPRDGHRFLHMFAPWLTLFPVMVAFAVIPFGEQWCTGTVSLNHMRDACVDGKSYNLFQIADLPVGILFIFAIASIGVYGNVIAGWASKSKFPLLGGLRASAQMISYEVTLGLSLIGIIMVFGTLNMQEMVRMQGDLFGGWLPRWGLFLQPVGALLFFAASIAETKRAPFDMPEAESELVAGYFTEYSSLRFAMFSLSEFVEVVLLSCVFSTIFLGGWQFPWLYADGFHFPHAMMGPVLGGLLCLLSLAGLLTAMNRKSGLLAACMLPPLLGSVALLYASSSSVPSAVIPVPYAGVQLMRVLAMVSKVAFLCWFQLMIRWTLPRFRYDQVMKLTWRYLLPLSLINILGTGLVILW